MLSVALSTQARQTPEGEGKRKFLDKRKFREGRSELQAARSATRDSCSRTEAPGLAEHEWGGASVRAHRAIGVEWWPPSLPLFEQGHQ